MGQGHLVGHAPERHNAVVPHENQVFQVGVGGPGHGQHRLDGACHQVGVHWIVRVIRPERIGLGDRLHGIERNHASRHFGMLGQGIELGHELASGDLAVAFLQQGLVGQEEGLDRRRDKAGRLKRGRLEAKVQGG